MSLTISPSALDRFKILLAKKPEAKGIWLTVTTKGCNGKSYKLDFVNDTPENTQAVQTDGVTVFIDPKAELYILGTEIDYVEEDLYCGFKFKNPNETGRCGCGTSFTTE